MEEMIGAEEGLIRRIGRGIVDNPVPLALISAGIAWLILSNQRRDDIQPARNYDSRRRLRRRPLTAASIYEDDLDDPAYRRPYTADEFYSAG